MQNSPVHTHRKLGESVPAPRRTSTHFHSFRLLLVEHIRVERLVATGPTYFLCSYFWPFILIKTWLERRRLQKLTRLGVLDAQDDSWRYQCVCPGHVATCGCGADEELCTKPHFGRASLHAITSPVLLSLAFLRVIVLYCLGVRASTSTRQFFDENNHGAASDESGQSGLSRVRRLTKMFSERCTYLRLRSHVLRDSSLTAAEQHEKSQHLAALSMVSRSKTQGLMTTLESAKSLADSWQSSADRARQDKDIQSKLDDIELMEAIDQLEHLDECYRKSGDKFLVTLQVIAFPEKGTPRPNGVLASRALHLLIRHVFPGDF